MDSGLSYLFSVDADQDIVALCAVHVVYAAQAVNKYRAHTRRERHTHRERERQRQRAGLALFSG